MRVQHNIMAMGAYRNYTNNVNAMKKNLERLSSGYKINRAGDDAAGLAISEKMRAQITGLETAQKNAKDGISLVQTAEGALQEVHDMLNRMVELATQSANGTYDNDTDRDQLQKEVNQLMSEINRIADSANFNGINLLDGTMAAYDAVAGGSSTNTELINGLDRIIKTVANGEQAWQVAGKKTILDGDSPEAQPAKFQINLGTMEFKVSGTTTDIASVGGTITIQIGDLKMTVNVASISATLTSSSRTVNAEDIANAFQNADSTKYDWIDDDGNVEINGVKWTITSSGDGVLEFEQVEEPKTADEARANFDVTITLKNDSSSKFEIKLDGATASDDPEMEGTYSVKVGTEVTTKGIAKSNACKANTVFEIRESDLVDGTKIAIGNLSLVLSIGKDTNVKATGDAKPKGNQDKTDDGELIVVLNDGDDLNTALSKISDRISVETANNTFKMRILDDDGNQKEVEFEIGVSDGSNGYPVGLAVQRVKAYDPDETSDDDAMYQFDTLEKLAQNFKMQVSSTTVTQSKEGGKGLTLQIGDTADSYNQLKVSINDCHTSAIGIGGISIADQESAAEAVDAIKAAINYISDVRGTLGATQNRLDHTINNLSVMTENIQDAESTIRDTDIAEEMMAYTKNNILIQSAQAMLAQANQVPQGVLQLLQ